MSGSGNGAGFRPDEVVTVQGRAFPVVGGRLRIAHEVHQGKLSIVTEIIDHQLDAHAVVRATVETSGGTFTATGTATATRDPKLADSLLELAETRAVARALRYAGIGVECVGFEELGAGPVLEGEPPHQELRVAGGNGHRAANGNGGGHHPPATSAQRRAIIAIARSSGREVEDLVGVLYPSVGIADLTLSMASSVIERARGKSNGNGNGNGNGHAAGPGR